MLNFKKINTLTVIITHRKLTLRASQVETWAEYTGYFSITFFKNPPLFVF